MAPGMAAAPAGPCVHLTRRPLHSATDQLVGRDLDFSDVPGTTGATGADLLPDADPLGPLTRALVSTLVEYPLGELTGDGLQMVGLTAPLVTGDLPIPFDPGAALVRTTLGADGERSGLAALAGLVEAGHLVALDGLVNSASARPALAVAGLAAGSRAVVDVPAGPDDRLRWDDVAAIAAAAHEHGVGLVARGAADPLSRERCAELGFDLFLGPLPVVLLGDGRLHPQQASALQLLGELSDPLSEIDEIASVIRTDPALSFELLRVSNSAAYGYSRSISEIRDAVVIVGLARLRAWVALVALSPTSRPSDALTGAVVSARMCELLAGRLHLGPPGAAFVVGLLDGVAGALGLRVGQLLETLPRLARELVDALNGEDGVLHQLLDATRCYQAGDLAGLVRTQVAHRAATSAYLDALAWSVQTTRAVTDRDPADQHA